MNANEYVIVNKDSKCPFCNNPLRIGKEFERPELINENGGMERALLSRHFNENLTCKENIENVQKLLRFYYGCNKHIFHTYLCSECYYGKK